MHFTLEGGHSLCRASTDAFKIDNTSHAPVADDALLSGRVMTPRLPGTPEKRKNSTAEELQKDKEEMEYYAWQEKLTMKKFEERLQKAKLKKKADATKRLAAIMKMYREHYLGAVDSNTREPLLDKVDVDGVDHRLMHSAFIQEIAQNITRTTKIEQKVLSVSAEVEAYRSKFRELIEETKALVDPKGENDAQVLLDEATQAQKKLEAELDASEVNSSQHTKPNIPLVPIIPNTKVKLEEEIRSILNTPRTPKGDHKSTPITYAVEPLKLFYEEVPDECFTIE